MKLELEIPDEHIAVALCSGFESGIGYWARDMMPFIPTENREACIAGATLNAKPVHSGDFFLSYFYPMHGGEIAFFDKYDVEDSDDADEDGPEDKGTRLSINAETLARGLALMASTEGKHFGNLIANDSDAVTGDVLIQLCTLGEVRYG